MSSRKGKKKSLRDDEEEIKSTSKGNKSKRKNRDDESKNDIIEEEETDEKVQLDYSNQKLESVDEKLNDLKRSESDRLANCTVFILNTNCITGTLSLSEEDLPKLNKLRVSDNLIKSANLIFKKLHLLDLSKNELKTIPNFDHVPGLKRLNLSHNLIEDTNFEKFTRLQKLKVLDISYNKLENDLRPQEFKKVIESFDKMSRLKRLYCHHNKMFEDDTNLRELKSLAKSSTNRFDVNPEEKFEAKIQSNLSKMKKNQNFRHILSDICTTIEKVNSVPSQAERWLNKLKQISVVVRENLEAVEQSFNKNAEGDEQEKDDMIEYFIQNAEMVAETQSNCQDKIVIVLINLGHLKSNSFGKKWFTALQDLMSSSNKGDIYSKIKKNLQESIISKFTNDSGLDSSQSHINNNLPVLRGLWNIIEKWECNDILNDLHQKGIFLSWLNEIANRKDEEKSRMKTKSKSKSLKNKNMEEIYKWRIGLISISLKNSQENITLFVQKNDMIKQVIKLFKKTKPVDEKYIFLIRIIQYTASKDESIAREYMSAFVDENFKYDIRDKLVIYKKFGTLTENEEEKNNKIEEQRQLEFKILTAQIDCLGGLLNWRSKEMKDFVKQNLHEEILSILSLYDADPLLLLSCCKYTKAYFSHDKVRDDETLLEMRLPKIDNCTKLLQYLGGTSCEKALKQWDKYLNLEATNKLKNGKLDLSDQHNSLMNDLVISILNLIELICKEAVRKKSSSHKYFKKISDILNENDRERYLFNWFDIPYDQVKLALVHCILQVPLKELDIEEINYLMKVVRETKNIGAGQAEEIISAIFLIFIKLIKDQENIASNSFRVKYGKTAISQWLKILLKNQSRKIEEEEEAEEKLTLSISCLYFLKEASREPDMRRFMSESDFKQDFIKNLLAEDENCFKDHHHIPIEIEYTELGSQFSKLRDCLIGSKSLKPFKTVSFRVIQQIANVLQHTQTTHFNMPKSSRYYHKVDEMKQNLIDGLQKRIKGEMDLWSNKEQFNNYTENLLHDKNFFNRMDEEHGSFAENSGLYMLVVFLTKKKKEKIKVGQENKDSEHELSKYEIWDNFTFMEDEFDLEYQNWNRFKTQNEQQAEEMIKQGQIIKSKYITNAGDNNRTKLRWALQRQKLLKASLYDLEEIEDHSLHFGKLHSLSKAQASQNKTDDRENEFQAISDITNMQKIENATVASFLRVIHASIDYSPKEEYKMKVISQLYDIHILKKITQLWYRSGWTAGNIGVKYLKIMTSAIERDKINQGSSFGNSKGMKGEQSKFHMLFNKLKFYEIMSKSIREILKQVDVSFSTKDSKHICEYK